MQVQLGVRDPPGVTDADHQPLHSAQRGRRVGDQRVKAGNLRDPGEVPDQFGAYAEALPAVLDEQADFGAEPGVRAVPSERALQRPCIRATAARSRAPLGRMSREP